MVSSYPGLKINLNRDAASEGMSSISKFLMQWRRELVCISCTDIVLSTYQEYTQQMFKIQPRPKDL